MFRILLVLLEFQAIVAYEVVFAINCGQVTHTILSTKYFNYTVDTYFEGLASQPQGNSLIPQTLVSLADRQLIKNHRTTTPGHDSFSYRPILPQPGYYIAIITMIETEYRTKNQRIMNIKLGDQIVHTVDVLGEVGYGRLLHKWIQIDVRDDIAFLNGTMPALNAFNFRNKQLRLVFQSVKNRPKIEALMLLKGIDSHQYLKQFLQFEQEKSVKVKQFVSEKYRRQPKLSYRPLLATDIIPPPESELRKLYNKFINFRSLGCILCGIFSVHCQQILQFFSNRIKSLQEKVRSLRENMQNRKKKD